MATYSSDQPAPNLSGVTSPQVRTSQLNTSQPSTAMQSGDPAPGTAVNPGLEAGQPAPSQGKAMPSTNSQSTSKAKTGFEGLTPHMETQASLTRERRREIIDIIAKHAEHLPRNCSVQLVEKLVEKHAERALKGVSDTIKAAKFRRILLKKAREKVAAGKNCKKVKFVAKGKKPTVTVKSKKPVRLKAKILKQSAVLQKLARPSVMREVIKKAEDKQKAARLFARLAKAASILKSKG